MTESELWREALAAAAGLLSQEIATAEARLHRLREAARQRTVADC